MRDHLPDRGNSFNQKARRSTICAAKIRHGDVYQDCQGARENVAKDRFQISGVSSEQKVGSASVPTGAQIGGHGGPPYAEGAELP